MVFIPKYLLCVGGEKIPEEMFYGGNGEMGEWGNGGMGEWT
ncbi:hypothetical protein HMPREF3038_01024 [Akkermansia sp. KLE1797]|nr:hypothetical protein HMPREF3038_01024 [Akkermansia sp. KLE1797]